MSFPSPAQRHQRSAFKRSCNCWHLQYPGDPGDGGGYGPASKQWWYNQAGGVKYYNYFIKQTINYFKSDQTPPWCLSDDIGISRHGVYAHHDDDDRYADEDELSALYIGSTMYGWPGNMSACRGAFQLDMSLLSLGEISQYSHAWLYMNVFHHGIFGQHFYNNIHVSFFEVVTLGNFFPESWTELDITGQIIDETDFEASVNGYTRPCVVDVFSILMNAYDRGENRAVIGIKADIEQQSNIDDYVIIWGIGSGDLAPAVFLST